MKSFMLVAPVLALGANLADAMNADPNACHMADIGNGEQACIKMYGNAFQHWYSTEDGWTLCRSFVDGKEVYSFASGQGTVAGLECSSEVLTTSARRPVTGVPKYLQPVPHVSEAEQSAGEDESFVAKVAAARSSGRSLQGVTKLRNLVLMIRWADHKDLPLPAKSTYEKIMSKIGGDPEVAPTGSVTDVFNSNFYGRIQIETTVVGWVDSRYTHAQAAGTPKSDGTSCGGTCSTGAPRLRTAILEALAAADGSIVNIGDFDGDGDGSIDLFTVIHSGHGAETLGGKEEGINWIWSHKWSMSSTYRSKSGNVRISTYNVNPGRWGTEGFEPSRIGVVAHESCHFLGLPDLYDTDYSSRGIANYGLMANSWGVDGSQQYPPSLSPWSKYQLGVVDPIEINSDGVFELPAVQSGPTGTVGILRMKYGSTTYSDYLLVENRAKTGFDSLLTGGILLWHVDPNKSNNAGEGYPGKAGWPSSHYKVRVIQADGKFDLEQPIADGNRGDDGDWFFAGNGPSEISDLTEPSLAGYSFISSSTRCSGHLLKDFSAPGSTMTFTYVRMRQDCSGLPEATTPAPSQPTPPPVAAPSLPAADSWTCPSNYFNANDGCDCGCSRFGTIRDPDCDKSTPQAGTVYCNGASSATRNAVCNANNQCEVNSAPGLDVSPGVSKADMVAASTEQPSTNVVPIAGGIAGFAFVALGAALVVHRRRASASKFQGASVTGAPDIVVTNPRYATEG